MYHEALFIVIRFSVYLFLNILIVFSFFLLCVFDIYMNVLFWAIFWFCSQEKSENYF